MGMPLYECALLMCSLSCVFAEAETSSDQDQDWKNLNDALTDIAIYLFFAGFAGVLVADIVINKYYLTEKKSPTKARLGGLIIATQSKESNSPDLSRRNGQSSPNCTTGSSPRNIEFVSVEETPVEETPVETAGTAESS